MDALISAGWLGLQHARETWTEGAGVSWAAYATVRIRRSILDELRAQDPIPRKIRAKLNKLHRCRDRLAARLFRSPTLLELSRDLGLTPEQMSRWLVQTNRENDVSLSQVRAASPVPHGRRAEPEREVVAEALAKDAEIEVRLIEREEIRRALHLLGSELDARKRVIVERYYLESASNREIAASIGLSEGYTSQLRTRALRELRELMEVGG